MSYTRPRPRRPTPAPVGYLGAIEPDRMMALIATGTVIAGAATLGLWWWASRKKRR